MKESGFDPISTDLHENTQNPSSQTSNTEYLPENLKFICSPIFAISRQFARGANNVIASKRMQLQSENDKTSKMVSLQISRNCNSLSADWSRFQEFTRFWATTRCNRYFSTSTEDLTCFLKIAFKVCAFGLGLDGLKVPLSSYINEQLRYCDQFSLIILMDNLLQVTFVYLASAPDIPQNAVLGSFSPGTWPLEKYPNFRPTLLPMDYGYGLTPYSKK